MLNALIKEGIAREQPNEHGQLRLALADTQLLEAARMWVHGAGHRCGLPN